MVSDAKKMMKNLANGAYIVIISVVLTSKKEGGITPKSGKFLDIMKGRTSWWTNVRVALNKDAILKRTNQF